MVKNLKPASTNYKANRASHDGRNLSATAPSSVGAPRGAPAPEYVRFPDLFARKIIQIPNFKEKPLRPPLAASSPIRRAFIKPQIPHTKCLGAAETAPSRLSFSVL